MIRVLGLASYPVESAAVRLRLNRLVEPLCARGIEIQVRPFLTSRAFAMLYDPRRRARIGVDLLLSSIRRLTDVTKSGRYDVVFLQREAAPIGPPLVEWLLARVAGLAYVLDLDDATWVSYSSPTHGRLASAVKTPSKADWLIRNAAIVTCGSRVIAEHAASLGARTMHVPTMVDLDDFAPSPRRAWSSIPTIGWIGSHSTWQYVEPLLPVLARVAAEHTFRFLVVGHGRGSLTVPGITVDAQDWSLTREIHDFQSIDIGLYPITPGEYAEGKSGLKAVQYMSAGVPFVASPVGEMAHLGEPGRTHLLADSPGEWYSALTRLISDEMLRRSMGKAGRSYAEAHFGTERAADLVAEAIQAALGRAITDS